MTTVMDQFRIAWCSDIGHDPRQQQDALLVGSRVMQRAHLAAAEARCGSPLLLAVADGVTLGPAGDAASRGLLEILAGLHQERLARGEAKPLNGRDLRSAQFHLCERLAESTRTRGAATTVVLAHVIGSVARILHVGDSRAYLLKADGVLVPLTRDHTAARMMVEEGDLPACDEQTLPSTMRMLAGAIVADYDADDFPVDSTDVALRPGEYLVLCSDGAIGGLAGSLRTRPGEATGAIDVLTLARRAVAPCDGSDNASVIVAGIDGGGSRHAARVSMPTPLDRV